MFATLGPLHEHRAPAAVVVLDDLRRGPAQGLQTATRAAQRHGHDHGAATALRHHHDAGAASVELALGEALQGDVDESSATLAAVVAIVA
ncbi:MAG: hypothetical protein ABIQ33_11330, partial [Caldimonas sp.]